MQLQGQGGCGGTFEVLYPTGDRFKFKVNFGAGGTVFECKPLEGSYIQMKVKKPMIESNVMNCSATANDK